MTLARVKTWIAGEVLTASDLNTEFDHCNNSLAVSTELAASSGSSLIGFIQSGTGAVARTMQGKERDSVSVFDFMTAAQIADVQANTASLDVTTPLQNALAAQAGGMLFAPKGTYKITASLTVQANTFFYGVGPQSVLLQYTSNIPILYAQSERTKVSDLQLKYNTYQTGIGNRWANAVHCQLLYESILERLHIYNAYCGIYCQYYTTNAADATGNYIYSCRISDIRVNQYGNLALNLSTVSNNNSGNLLENLYLINTGNTTTNGVNLQNWDDGVLEQINIEHATHTGPSLIINNCNNLTINGLHFEAITVPVGNDFIGLIDMATARANISGLTVVSNTFSPATFYAVVRLNAAYVTITNMQERSNTVAAATKPMFYAVGGVPTARLINYTLGAFTSSFSGTGTFLQDDNTFSSIAVPGAISIGAINYQGGATYLIVATDSVISFGAACTVTLPSASSSTNRTLIFKVTANTAIISASSNVVPEAGGAAGTAILGATAGKWAFLQSDGSNWIVVMSN